MALAWSTVALIVLLLPGVLFFLGLYVPEQFTRDTTPKNALGQLAGVVLISFVLHSTYLTIFAGACHWEQTPWWPCVNLETVLALLSVANPSEKRLAGLATDLHAYAPFTLLYIGLSSLAGWLGGRAIGRSIAHKGTFRFLVEHQWVLELPLHDRVGRTYAYVMTRLTHEGRSLIYEGRLRQFGLLANGQFSYLVLIDPKRRYMRLDYTSATVDNKPFTISADSKKHEEGDHIVRYFVVAGADVAHVIFDRLSVTRNETVARELRQSVERFERGEEEAVYQFYGVTPPFGGATRAEQPVNPKPGTQ